MAAGVSGRDGKEEGMTTNWGNDEKKQPVVSPKGRQQAL
jgi:hypothetical protein